MYADRLHRTSLDVAPSLSSFSDLYSRVPRFQEAASTLAHRVSLFTQTRSHRTSLEVAPSLSSFSDLSSEGGFSISSSLPPALISTPNAAVSLFCEAMCAHDTPSLAVRLFDLCTVSDSCFSRFFDLIFEGQDLTYAQ